MNTEIKRKIEFLLNELRDSKLESIKVLLYELKKLLQKEDDETHFVSSQIESKLKELKKYKSIPLNAVQIIDEITEQLPKIDYSKYIVGNSNFRK